MTPPVFAFPAAATVSVGDTVVLDGVEGRHAADVRRLRSGEAIRLTDGAGAVVDGEVSVVRRGSLDIAVTSTSYDEPPSLRIVVAQALAKGGRDESAVEVMTELGVDEVIGWQAERSIAKWTERTAAKWTSTVTAAAKQSRRSRWPVVTGPCSTGELAQLCAHAALALVLHESAAVRLIGLDLPTAGNLLVIVGPEGGITDGELDQLTSVGARVVRLGPEILRSSTAGAVALAVINAVRRW